ncbi:MAG: hypothetical protein ACRELV_11725 [Longimicrobiales bacterium]
MQHRLPPVGMDPTSDQREFDFDSEPESRAAESPPFGARSRSFGFLEREDERWTVFLVTYPASRGDWRGYFAFRPASAGAAAAEIRTADLFVEDAESEIGARARGLGRPLVMALLESALQTWERRRGLSADARRWFRDLLARHARSLVLEAGEGEDLSVAHLRSLYDSYRVDQVAHLITLLEPAHFRALVDRVLDGRSIDFGARDRLQLAMLVVQDLERRIPLPPFELWVEDFLSHRAAYETYAYQLHRERPSP